MKSSDVRKAFLDFFASKGHKIVPSAPIVVKNDPTLMFNNSGMAPFKDIFLGNKPVQYPRVADTQKCLRVSGKHNDLEEVGVDTYHHTMFEMLGNWSFGDYFKKEAIQWSWELLTEVYKLDKNRLYVTVFEGDITENLEFDQDSYNYWKQYISEDRILKGNKKDNFWEMGDSGPCGPCSEIHVDLRSDEERAKKDGRELVNNDHPQVVEIWNNVFMEFNRKADKSLEKLPSQHVDTGMGFERLCMALQGKQSNYDTDVFQPNIQWLSALCKVPYKGSNSKQDVAMRVIADHIRAISFTISDGQLPSNTGAGYVIRRILRRAVRYGYSFLGFEEPFMYKMVELLAEQFKEVFPELHAQRDFVATVIKEEETSFLRTLSLGIKRFNLIIEELKISEKNVIPGKVAFELFDTFGFPKDLTQLLASEQTISVDLEGFEEEMKIQKERAKAAATTEQGDWVVLRDENEFRFVGYDTLESISSLVKYRSVKSKEKELYQLVLDVTPFYAESGGQIGDKGILEFGDERIEVLDTKKENDLTVHWVKKLPSANRDSVKAKVDSLKRKSSMRNHSATHLLQSALRMVLGSHVQQKGSLVTDEYLRFDFAHFSKVTDDEIRKIEEIVNAKILENIVLDEKRDVPISEAEKSGATMLFGEKYGESVRIITFDPSFSRELCGGTHVRSTGEIGIFKITSESSISAGVRRIEALTGFGALAYCNEKLQVYNEISELLKGSKNLIQSVRQLQEKLAENEKQLEHFNDKQIHQLSCDILKECQEKGEKVYYYRHFKDGETPDFIRSVGAKVLKQLPVKTVLLFSIENKGKLAVQLRKGVGYEGNAGQWIKDSGVSIKGGGPADFIQASADNLLIVQQLDSFLRNIL